MSSLPREDDSICATDEPSTMISTTTTVREDHLEFMTTCTDVLTEVFSYVADSSKTIAAAALTCSDWGFAFDCIKGSKDTVSGRMILCQKIRNCERLAKNTDIDDEDRRLMAIETGHEVGDILRAEIDGNLVRQTQMESDIRTELHNHLRGPQYEYRLARTDVLHLQQGDMNAVEWLSSANACCVQPTESSGSRKKKNAPLPPVHMYVAMECIEVLELPTSDSVSHSDGGSVTAEGSMAFNNFKEYLIINRSDLHRRIGELDVEKVARKYKKKVHRFVKKHNLTKRIAEYPETSPASQFPKPPLSTVLDASERNALIVGSLADCYDQDLLKRQSKVFSTLLAWLNALHKLIAAHLDADGSKTHLEIITAKRTGLLDLHKRCIAAVDDLVLPPNLRSLVWDEQLKRKKIAKKWKHNFPVWHGHSGGEDGCNAAAGLSSLDTSPARGAVGGNPRHQWTPPMSATGLSSPHKSSPHAIQQEDMMAAVGGQDIFKKKDSRPTSALNRNAPLPQLPQHPNHCSTAQVQSIMEMTRQFSDSVVDAGAEETPVMEACEVGSHS